jgi:large subunit ribosomal protein L24
MSDRPVQKKFHVKRGDLVQVIRGEQNGKQGKVLQVMRESARAVVEGVNMIKRHQRKSQSNPEGGILEKEAPLPVSCLRRVEAGTEKYARKRGAEKAS